MLKAIAKNPDAFKDFKNLPQSEKALSDPFGLACLLATMVKYRQAWEQIKSVSEYYKLLSQPGDLANLLQAISQNPKAFEKFKTLSSWESSLSDPWGLACLLYTTEKSVEVFDRLKVLDGYSKILSQPMELIKLFEMIGSYPDIFIQFNVSLGNLPKSEKELIFSETQTLYENFIKTIAESLVKKLSTQPPFKMFENIAKNSPITIGNITLVGEIHTNPRTEDVIKNLKSNNYVVLEASSDLQQGIDDYLADINRDVLQKLPGSYREIVIEAKKNKVHVIAGEMGQIEMGRAAKDIMAKLLKMGLDTMSILNATAVYISPQREAFVAARIKKIPSYKSESILIHCGALHVPGLIENIFLCKG